MITQSIFSNIRLAICLSTLLLSGCGHILYLAQAVAGQSEILAKRQPIQKLVADDGTAPELRRQLQTIQALRSFASAELALPDNGSYLTYADLQRPYAVWNVVAAPEFSIQPRRWCFPVAGCVAYRGYFKQHAAQQFANNLEARGDDVFLGGVAAYSTLGWFDDPVLNTFVHAPKERLAALIFHELAHQVIYVKDDTTFNESFAVAVEQEGVKRWLAAENRIQDYRRYLESQAHRRRTIDLLLDYRTELEALYGNQELEVQEMRRRKQAILSRLQRAYWIEREKSGDGTLDGWFSEPLNNALLATVSAYAELVPAFESLLREEGGDLAAFYQRVGEVAALGQDARRQALMHQ